MTTYFVSAVDGSNADSGADWTNAKQTVAGALAIPAVTGDVILVDSAGTFSAGAAITWTPPAGNVAIISVNRAGGDAWLAGATETVGASNNGFSIVGAANSTMFVFGMTLNGGTNNSANCFVSLLGSNSTIASLYMRSCAFNLNTVNTGAFIYIGGGSGTTQRPQRITLESCSFNSVGSRGGPLISLNSSLLDIINPTITTPGATKPTALFRVQDSSIVVNMTVRDGDLTGMATNAYIDVTSLASATITLRNIKLHATPTLTTGTYPGGIGSITLINTDDADTINVRQFTNAYGTAIQDTSVYLDNGLDWNGAGISWLITTTAACNEYKPFVVPLIYAWNTSTAAQTAEIEFVRDNATPLTDREIWSDMDYPATASFPNYTYASNRNANPFTGTPANQTTSTAAWTGTGGFGTSTEQKLQIAFTAAEVGMLRANVYVGKASETLYMNPGITNTTDNSGAQVVWLDAGALGKAVTASGGGGFPASRILAGM